MIAHTMKHRRGHSWGMLTSSDMIVSLRSHTAAEQRRVHTRACDSMRARMSSLVVTRRSEPVDLHSLPPPPPFAVKNVRLTALVSLAVCRCPPLTHLPTTITTEDPQKIRLIATAAPSIAFFRACQALAHLVSLSSRFLGSSAHLPSRPAAVIIALAANVTVALPL
eukprot:6193415-Pleurochrysis_carterae.AAC.1